ncbi:DUF4422 domain-containing protein [Bifidobacterium apri]|uniref:DUF4422 domain-containing protein n=1 Tax=Bifidobacterium apri TaxID=1769423 RepID=UPI0035E65276
MDTDELFSEEREAQVMSETSSADNIKIFVSCHKPGIHFPNNSLLQPIHVGAALSPIVLPGVQRDDEGDTISEKNKSYCELTGQYWAWKNTSADYYGFLHYRRYFNFTDTKFPEHQEPFIFGDVVFDRNDDQTLAKIGFNEDTMRKVITSHDFIAPTPVEALDHATVYEQYQASAGHHIEDLDTCMAIIRQRYPEIWRSAKKYLSNKKVFACNMFVMKKDIFNRYCEFLFSVLAEHERLRDISHYSAIGRRVSGYLGERLCGIYLQYLYDEGYNGIDLQRVFFRNPNDSVTDAVKQHQETSSSNAIRMSHISRGTGKVYSLINIDEDIAYDGVIASSASLNGHQLPSKLLTINNKLVLVLPLIRDKQTVSIRAVRDGKTVEDSQVVLSPKGAAAESRFNTLRRDAVASAIRRCDENLVPEDVQVHIEQIIPDLDGTDIVHGSVVIPITGMHNDPHEFVDIQALNDSGEAFNLSEWVCMGDLRDDTQAQPGLQVRRISYSLRVPSGSTFFVWAHFPDSDAQDGFQYCDAASAMRMRMQWKLNTLPACQAGNYDSWFRNQHKSRPDELELQRKVAFETRPKFSIIVPLYKTPISFLRDMASSVLNQTYSSWELLLVNASSEDAQLDQAVSSLCKSDKRIKEIRLPENQGITLNTNAGITAATGDFLCFLDHDDFLEPDALYWYALAVNKHPETGMLYCDEDKYDGGTYREPFFKPDWNPDLLLGMNYVCHFLTVRKSIMDTLDLPGKEYDGSQDWHMTFRIGEQAKYVHHEPRVLYHWRVHSNSTAQNAEQKSYTLDSSKLAVQTHLERERIDADVEESPIAPRRFVVKYHLGNSCESMHQEDGNPADLSAAEQSDNFPSEELTHGEPLVSIIIPNKDSVPVLHRCLMSIRKFTTYHNYEIVVVENNSNDNDTFTYYEKIQHADARIRVVYDKDVHGFNFSQIVNFGARNAQGDYFLLLNNDTEVITPDWIQELVGPCTRKDVGITGAKLLFPDDTIQHAGIACGPDGPGHLYYQMPYRNTGNFEATIVARDVAAVTGACMMVSRKTFEEVQGYDEDLAVNYNDVDFCYRVRKIGKLVVFCPTAMLRHYESVSRGPETSGPKAIRFQKERGQLMERWPETFSAETAPYTNPNLIFGNMYEVLNPAPTPVKEW